VVLAVLNFGGIEAIGVFGVGLVVLHAVLCGPPCLSHIGCCALCGRGDLRGYMVVVVVVASEIKNVLNETSHRFRRTRSRKRDASRRWFRGRSGKRQVQRGKVAKRGQS
jgi:hypothetical protein